jgi:hypothetical protein
MTGFDEKWLEDHQRKMAGIQKKSVPAAPVNTSHLKRQKYGNKKVEFDGILKSVHGLDEEEI